MRNKVIAIDVDLTVVDTLTPWLDWFKSKTGRNILNEDHTYDLVPEMRQIIKEVQVAPFDPMDFWKKPDLYDDLAPAEGCVEAIKELSKNYEIVFVSSCVSEHINSKISFLQRNFGHHVKFISTFHKEFVAYDYLIDDRLHHILVGQEVRSEAFHILYTGYRADGHYHERKRLTTFNDWKKILNFFFPDY
jgi:5'(3')-deoxyribonucleotidase